MSHIIAIGYLGGQRCYLDISEEEATERYLRDEGMDDLEDMTVKRIEVKDGCFGAYEVWET